MSIGTKILLVICILAGLGISVLIVYAGQPLPLIQTVVTVPILEDTPLAALTHMSQTMQDVTTAHYSMDIEPADAPLNTTIQIDYDGQLYPQIVGVLQLGTEIEFDALRLVMGVESRMTDTWAYTSITELPAIPFMQFDAIDGTWYRFPNHSTDLGLDHIFSIFSTVQNIERLPDAIVQDVKMYHYSCTFDLGSWGESLDLPFTMPRHARVPAEIWIGKEDNRLYQFTSESDIGTIRLVVSDYGQSVTVEEPLTAQPIEDLPTDLFVNTATLDLPLFAPLMGIDIGEGASDSDGDGLLTFWENIFHTNPQKADTDGDGFSDRDEIRNGYNPSGPDRLLPVPANPTEGE